MDMETGATARPVLSPDSAVMRLSDVSHDGQPQAGAPLPATPRAVHPVEAVEDSLERIWREPQTVVGDREPRLGGPAPDGHLDCARR